MTLNKRIKKESKITLAQKWKQTKLCGILTDICIWLMSYSKRQEKKRHDNCHWSDERAKEFWDYYYSKNCELKIDDDKIVTWVNFPMCYFPLRIRDEIFYSKFHAILDTYFYHEYEIEGWTKIIDKSKTWYDHTNNERYGWKVKFVKEK